MIIASKIWRSIIGAAPPVSAAESCGQRGHHREGVGSNVFSAAPVTVSSRPVDESVTELEQVPKKGRLPLPVARIVLVLMVALVVVVMVPVVMLVVPVTWLIVILLWSGIRTRLEK
jgi:hypothetical protein